MKPKKIAAKNTTYMLRTCAADMTSYEGFVWPNSGWVCAPDWSDKPECGKGLHGFLVGKGDGNLAKWEADAKWLVVKIDSSTVVDLNGKIKVPYGYVEYCGNRESATEYLASVGFSEGVIGGTATAGYRGTATAGDRGTATAGYRGILSMRWWDGKRYRVAIFYVGEDGIEANVPYRCVDGKAVRN